jgi:ATP-dependent Clp protease protease subunit
VTVFTVKEAFDMYSIVKSSNGISLIPVESRLFSERKLFIEGEITSKTACDFVKQIMLLVKEDSEKAIDIYINSFGGEVNAGLMIYDTIKGLKNEVNLHCVGIAASMAAIILAGGRKGHRYILPHSKVMIHEPLIEGNVGGSATSIKRTAESIMETKKMAVELLSKDTGKSKKQVETAISFDNYMNADEAIDFGICDCVEKSVLGGMQ